MKKKLSLAQHLATFGFTIAMTRKTASNFGFNNRFLSLSSVRTETLAALLRSIFSELQLYTSIRKFSGIAMGLEVNALLGFSGPNLALWAWMRDMLSLGSDQRCLVEKNSLSTSGWVASVQILTNEDECKDDNLEESHV